MHWYQGNEEEEEYDLMYSPALLARRASESWIDSAPIEVVINLQKWKIKFTKFL
jgi:junctophilin